MTRQSCTSGTEQGRALATLPISYAQRRELDTTLGDALAALSPAARDSTAYRALIDAALTYATAALRHCLDMAPTVRLLRRFLAALLPPDGGDEGSDDGTNAHFYSGQRLVPPLSSKYIKCCTQRRHSS